MLAGAPHMRPPLVDLANLITKNNSLMVVGEVISVNIRNIWLQFRHYFYLEILLSVKFRIRRVRTLSKKVCLGWWLARLSHSTILCKALISKRASVHCFKLQESENFHPTLCWWATKKTGCLAIQPISYPILMSCSTYT